MFTHVRCSFRFDPRLLPLAGVDAILADLPQPSSFTAKGICTVLVIAVEQLFFIRNKLRVMQQHVSFYTIAFSGALKHNTLTLSPSHKIPGIVF